MPNKNILAVLEDSPARKKLAEGLRMEGYGVDEVHSHSDASLMIKEHPFGLVVADISAPLVDSLSFLAFFKDKNPVGKIIVLSKKPEFSSAIQSMRLYASDYLFDPIASDILSSSVDRAFFDSEKAISRMRAHAAEENLRLREELDKANLDTIMALAGALEARDEYTCGHSARVAELSVRVGERLHLPDEDIKRLRYGGILHDIGKIGVDRGILNKKTSLSREEFNDIYEHADIGVRIVSHVDSLKGVVTLIKYHHEPYEHLSTVLDPKSREFLLVGIIKAVDAYDAMVSDRPYRKAMPPDMALVELMNYSGVEFHPRVVEEIAMIVRGDKVSDLRKTEAGTFFIRGPLAPGYL